VELQPTYQVTTAPTEAAAVFGVPYDFLRLEVGQDAADLSLMLNAAVEVGEAYTNRVFRLTSFTGLFPCLHANERERLFVEIGRSPLIDVQEVRIFDEDADTATTVTGEIVRLPSFSRVFMPKDFDLTPDPDREYPIEVDFRAGYSIGSPTFPELAIPSAIKLGLVQHVAYLYENRGDVAGDFADAIPDDVIRSYRRVVIPLGGG